MSEPAAKLEYLKPKQSAPASEPPKASAPVPAPPTPQQLSPEQVQKGFLALPKEAVDFYAEHERKQANKSEKVIGMFKSNPLVPLGCVATVFILLRGVVAMKNKDTAKSQKMMRWRVAAQGSTILALVAGTLILPYFTSSSSKSADE